VACQQYPRGIRRVRHVGQKCRLEEKALAIRALSAGHDFGTFGQRILDETDHVVLRSLVD
jgi:hypothetical protein